MIINDVHPPVRTNQNIVSAQFPQLGSMPPRENGCAVIK
jgi:hypothetical protein